MKTTTKKIIFTSQICPALATVALLWSASQPAWAATDTWTGFNGNTWANANLTGGNSPPMNGDSLVFGSSGIGSLDDNLSGALTTYGITFNSGAYNTGGYTLFNGPGCSIFLSGQASGNIIGITNGSTGLQTVNLNLNLDWGYYTFSDPAVSLALGGTLTLNSGGVLGTTVPNAGGVAFFDSTGTISTSLANDASGLISGLGGAGLMYNISTGNPTGLATVSGGDIIAYPSASYTVISSGSIGTGATKNIKFNTSGATGTYTASGAIVNTITSIQAGTQTDTLTVTGTLTLGGTSGIGGIYALNGTVNPSLLTVTGGTLTAGITSAGGTIVFGGNDSTQHNFAPNVATVASSITDNSSSGKVAVVKVGVSSMSMSSSANTYSGGMYILQGQIQAGSSWGSGPIYI